MKAILTFMRFSAGSLLLGGALTLGLYGLTTASNQSWADEDDDDDRYEYRGSGYAREPIPPPGTSNADASLYKQECGSCHVAYPAKFLPSYSWLQIMNTLDDHYGDDASLDDASRAEILAYLSAHSASQHSRYLRSVSYGETPTRITELPWFQRKHDEVPRRLVQDNPEVGSFSQCDACHQRAAEGQFDEDTVVIPGAGRWDD